MRTTTLKDEGSTPDSTGRELEPLSLLEVDLTLSAGEDSDDDDETGDQNDGDKTGDQNDGDETGAQHDDKTETQGQTTHVRGPMDITTILNDHCVKIIESKWLEGYKKGELRKKSTFERTYILTHIEDKIKLDGLLPQTK